MTSRLGVGALIVLAPAIAAAQMQKPGARVSPATVNVGTQGVTTAMLTISGVQGYAPAEGLWCATVTSFNGSVRCDPATIYGQSQGGAGTVSAGGVFTDLMSVPATVAQRAYEAVLAGQQARFFYVRHFVEMGAVALDQYVVVTCLLGGGGASAPFALTNVRLRVESDAPVVFVQRGEVAPAMVADIAYTGTGRLRGRWELVVPGEERPSAHDLLTEASLPPAERGLQRRYREIERFNVLLMPTGRVTLQGPDPARLPTSIDGSYTILLRIETSEDPFSDTQIDAGAGGQQVVHNGATAGFPMPTLRYIVGSSRTRSAPPLAPRPVLLRSPDAGAIVSPDSGLTLSWVAQRGRGRHRVEIEREADGVTVLSAIVADGIGAYDVPPFAMSAARGGTLRWRVVAIDAAGIAIRRSEWRTVQGRP